MSPAPDKRDRIHAAMDRILGSTAENSNGALTIIALAHEAGVPRNALTQRHTDLRAQFYAHVQERSGTSEVDTRLRQTITRLKATIVNKNTELDRLRTDLPALIRTINVLTLETSNSARHTHRPTRPSCRSRLDTGTAPTDDPKVTVDEDDRRHLEDRW